MTKTDGLLSTQSGKQQEEPFEFLGYRIGRNYRPHGKGTYIGTRPSKASVQSICRRISGMTARKHGWRSAGDMVARLNRAMLGWAYYYSLGSTNRAYQAVSGHAIVRLRRWLCEKHKVRSGKLVRFPAARLFDEYGLARLERRTLGLPNAKA